MAYVNFGRKNTREEALASTNKDKIFFPIDADTIIMGGREYGKETILETLGLGIDADGYLTQTIND